MPHVLLCRMCYCAACALCLVPVRLLCLLCLRLLSMTEPEADLHLYPRAHFRSWSSLRFGIGLSGIVLKCAELPGLIAFLDRMKTSPGTELLEDPC